MSGLGLVRLAIGFLRCAGRIAFASAGDRSYLALASGLPSDSGAFSELSIYGEWRLTVREYHRAVRRYDDEIGSLSWAAPLDLMCEPEMIAKTGLTVQEHQRRTVENFVELQELWDGKDYDNPYMTGKDGCQRTI